LPESITGAVPLNNQENEFLKPTFVIDCDHPSIQEKASELIKGQTDAAEKAKSLFYFVRNEIRYNLYVDKYLAEFYKASNTLTRKEGYCVQKAVLLTALARAAGIPARLGFARLRNNAMSAKLLNWLGSSILPFHGFSELYIDGNWVRATPTFDLKTCERGRIIPVEFDGRHDAMFHPVNLDGDPHMEYLEFLGSFPDVPLERLWKTVTEHFGEFFIRPSQEADKA
jgi:transglutaminase-like putative cysteine protease